MNNDKPKQQSIPTCTPPSGALTPAIIYDHEPDPNLSAASAPPEQKVIFVDGNDALILQSADAIEKTAWRAAKATCERGTNPAICYVNGNSEMERKIVAVANKLPAKYQMEYGLPLPPVLYPNPNLLPADFENVVAAMPEQREQREGADGPNQRSRFGTCIYTDLELAQLFIQRTSIRRKGQQAYYYNGAFYQPLTNNDLQSLVLGHLRAELNANGNSRKIQAVVDAILAEPEIQVQKHEMKSRKVCLRNGLLDIVTLQLFPHNPGYFVDWQLNAFWDTANLGCPYFDRYLQDVTGGDPILLQRFWEATGYLLVGEGNVAKRIFVLHGPSDTGKSVYGSLLRGFFHPEQIASVDAFKLGDRFSTSALVKAQLNLAMDLPFGSLSEQAVGMIKSISGSDAVTVEVKYHTPYTTKLSCKLVFATNHPIRSTVADKALARRLMILPFQYPIPRSRQNPELLHHLLNERDAILYRAVQAYRILRANNYVFAGDDLFDNAAIMGIADDSAAPADMAKQFADTCCVRAPEQFVPTEQVYEAYRAFCQREGVRCSDSCQQFSARIFPIFAAKYQVTRRKKRVEGVPRNGYEGVQLISEIP